MLEIITSISGLGKTEYIINDIEKNKFNNKIIILTPEQNGYNFEKMLCEKFNATLNIDVMNFNSFSKKFLKQLLINKNNILTEEEKLFNYYNILKKIKNKDNFLVKRAIQDINFLEVVDEITKELKEYDVSLVKLEKYLKENKEASNYNKIKDIYEFYFEYNNYLVENSKIDNKDMLKVTYQDMQYLDLKDYVIYIDGYYNFNLSEYKIIEQLIKYTKKVVISVITDVSRYTNFNFDIELENNNCQINFPNILEIYTNVKYSLDIFRKSHEVIANINEIKQRLKIKKYNIINIFYKNHKKSLMSIDVEDDVIKNIENLEVKNKDIRYLNDDIKKLALEYPKISKSQFFERDNIKIIKATNIEQELRQVSREIFQLKKLGVLDSDIAILYRDEIYENYINIFKEYAINVHLDKDEQMNNHRLIKLVENILNYDDDNFQTDILNILKSKLINLDYISLEEADSCKSFSISEIEDILKKYNIKTYKHLKNEQFLLEKKYNVEDLSFLRKKLEKLVFCINKIKSGKCINDYICSISSLLEEFKVYMTIENNVELYDDLYELKLESIDRQVYTKFLSVLDNLEKVSDVSISSFSDFRKLFLLSLKNIKYRKIPEIDNYTIFSKIDLAKVENKKIVFVVGFSNDNFPRKISNNGIIDDKDKGLFLKNEIYLSPDSKSTLVDEEFVSYIGLTRAREKLFVSFSQNTPKSRDNNISFYFEKIKNILPKLNISDVDSVININIPNLKKYTNKENRTEIFKNIYTIKEFNYIYNKLNILYNSLKSDVSEFTINLYEVIKEFQRVLKFKKKYDLDYYYDIYNDLSDENLGNKDYLSKDYLYNQIENNYENSLIERCKLSKKSVFTNYSNTKLDLYLKNKYIYFVKYILNIKEVENYEINALLEGSFYHIILDNEKVKAFIKDKSRFEKKEAKDYLEYREEIITVIFEVLKDSDNEVILKYLKLIDDAKINSYILKNAINNLVSAICVEIHYFAITGYSIFKTEYDFNIDIFLENENVKFRGKIDRIDKKDDNYAVIDYKKSENNFKKSDVDSGKISQLFCYMLALEKDFNVKKDNILGLYYREIAKSGNNLKNYRLRGVTNEDKIFVEDFVKNTADAFYLRITKANKINKSDKDAGKSLSSSDFEKIKNDNLNNIIDNINKINNFDFNINEDEMKYLYKYAYGENIELENNG